jgi:ABC-type sugar transport system substrate-binding protein
MSNGTMRRATLVSIGSLTCLLLAAALVAGCGRGRDEGSAGGAKKVTIAVFMPNGGDPYFQNKSYGYIKAEKELPNVDVQLFDAGGYENVEKQISQIEDAIQRHVDAMVVSATDSRAVCTSVEAALDAGIPVVGDDILPTCDRKIPFGMSENSVRVGFNNCSYMAKQMNGHGDVVMVKGPPGAQISIQRATGCKRAFAKYPGIKVVAEQWNPSNIDAANRVMDDFISAHGKSIAAAYSFNAVNALGIVNALQSAGSKPGDVEIATIDYHPEVLQYIKNGWISGTVPAQPVRLAYETTKAAYNLQAKRPVTGKSGIDPCCDKRAYTADDHVIDKTQLPDWDPSNAVAPKGWKPPLQS